ncbi:uncharacterized protein hemgn isoform X2 [Pagrus major]|uniref:uncharacterized protein hemgn isoform X2 n=1 Tax=Pagrus major TaxID=143350 RepID=UPI003CC854C1
MDETLQQEKQESEYVNPNEDKGGIGRRLRDRDLLRKRKAEAEEKETNQVESPRKRQRAAGDRSGTKKRGRPRKNEATAEISVMPEEAAAPQEAPAVVVVPEPAEVIPDQILAAVEVQPVPVLAAPAPQLVFGSLQNPLFAPAPFIPTPALFSPSVPAPAPTKDLDKAPIPVQDVAPASAPDDFPVPTSTQAPDPDEAPAPPTAPRQVGALYVAAQGREAPNQVLIDDLAPPEEEDIPPSQDKRVDEDLNGTPLINVPEQNKMFSVPTLSSTPPTQEYLPGNSY